MLGSLNNLETLDLSYLHFSGPLNATAVLNELTNLTVLTLIKLPLENTTSLFDVLPVLQNLTDVRLDHMSFQGPLSFSLSDLPNLEIVQIRNAELTGTLDALFSFDSQAVYPTNLQVLDLSDNPGLTGTLPRNVGLFSKLLEVDLMQCNLSGQLPAELWSLHGPLSLRLNNNTFNGTFPANLGDFSILSVLLLENNNLSGGLETIVGHYRANGPYSLRVLRLNNNPLLGGNLSTSLGLLSGLDSLELANCGLTGSIPSQIGALTDLQLLFLQDNALNGTIPSQVGALIQLSGVELHHNELVGPVPDSLCELVNAPQRFHDPFFFSFALDCAVLGASISTCEESTVCCTECLP